MDAARQAGTAASLIEPRRHRLVDRMGPLARDAREEATRGHLGRRILGRSLLVTGRQ